MKEKVEFFAKKVALFAKNGLFSIIRLFPSYLICFLPFLIFGDRNDIKLILWKTAVVGAGLIIFHFVRKSMFPYIDLRRSFDAVLENENNEKSIPLAMLALAQTILIAAMVTSIVFAMASGI